MQPRAEEAADVGAAVVPSLLALGDVTLGDRPAEDVGIGIDAVAVRGVGVVREDRVIPTVDPGTFPEIGVGCDVLLGERRQCRHLSRG